MTVTSPQAELDRAYVAARKRGRAGAQSRKMLRAAADRRGLCAVTDAWSASGVLSRTRPDQFQRIAGDVMRCQSGHPVVRSDGWYVHSEAGSDPAEGNSR